MIPAVVWVSEEINTPVTEVNQYRKGERYPGRKRDYAGNRVRVESHGVNDTDGDFAATAGSRVKSTTVRR